jgi:Uma2 family endonuclease
METLTKKITFAEFKELDFPDDDRFLYELLDGEPVQRNTPSIQHQRIARNVFRKLDQFVLAKNLGEVFFAPIALLVDDYNAPQPDVMFVSNKNTNALAMMCWYVRLNSLSKSFRPAQWLTTDTENANSMNASA